MTATATTRTAQPRRGNPERLTPAIYDTVIAHVRTDPLRNAFRYRSYQWLVDLDDLPRLPTGMGPLARFRARDHIGDPDRTLRENIDAFLAGHGIDLAGGRILMLTNARVLGYVFNPLSVFWCHDRDGGLVATVAEVHNTYGGRHAYLLRPDAGGRARAAKEFYVSPFNPVDGEYHLSLPRPDERLALGITLHRPGRAPFVATVRGRRRAGDRRGLARSMLRVPWVTVAIAAQIRWQGLRLWARRLPVVPRAPSDPHEHRLAPPDGTTTAGPSDRRKTP